MSRYVSPLPYAPPDAVPLESDRKFHRFALWASLVSLVLLVVAGAVFSLRARKSLHRQVERMELDVSRALDALLRATDDLSAPIDAVDNTATRWRSVFKQWPDIPFDLQPKVLHLQTLQDKVVPRWRTELASADSLQLRRRIILEDVLREQTIWPPPPPPPFVLALSDGVRDFGAGAFEGAAWPWIVGHRAAQLHRSPARVRIDIAARFILFPHRAAGLSFGMILGFGVFVTAVGYGFCHLGMRLNAGFFSFLGLLYFLYAVVYAVFVAFLLFGLLA